MDERASFRAGVVATNRGAEPVDPGLFGVRLLVDGEPSPAFDLALGNGVVPAGWDVLGPGESTPRAGWPLGEALFPAPGTYTLTLTLAGADLEPVETVVVTE